MNDRASDTWPTTVIEKLPENVPSTRLCRSICAVCAGLWWWWTACRTHRNPTNREWKTWWIIFLFFAASINLFPFSKMRSSKLCRHLSLLTESSKTKTSTRCARITVCELWVAADRMHYHLSSRRSFFLLFFLGYVRTFKNVFSADDVSTDRTGNQS